MTKHKWVALIVFSCLASTLVLSLGTIRTGKSPIPVPTDTNGGSVERSNVEHVILGDSVAECAEALRVAREVQVRRVRVTGEGYLVSDVAGFRSHGLLPRELKMEMRLNLQRSVSGVREQLRRAMESGRGDVVQEARYERIVQLRLAQLDVLERDEYVLLDFGAVDRIWPTSSDDCIVVRMQTIVLPSGLEVEIVMPIEVAKHAGLKFATENLRMAEQFTAVDAAYRFNGLPDAQRMTGVRNWRLNTPLGDIEAEKDREALLFMRLALRGDTTLDEVRGLLLAR